MKRILLLMLLVVSSTIAFAQTTWTGLGANTNWNNTDNWDTNLVPTAADDVIIPTGFTVTLNVSGTVQTIDVQGNSTFEMNSSFSFAGDSNFGPNTTINWSGGSLFGPTFTLTNQGVMNLIGTGGKTITSGTILSNENTINITSSGDLFISGADATLNNELNGVLDLQATSGNITWSSVPGVINNAGLIKKTTSTGEAQIIVVLNNNDGTIQVEEGTLSFQNAAKSFTDGTYNVFSGATLDWDVAATISGSLQGTLSGEMNWNNNITVAAVDTADLNFTENFNWTSGAVSGGGTLTNNGLISLVGGSGKTITGGSTLSNLGTIEITSTGDLFLSGAGTTLNNELSGVIDLQSTAGNITWSSVPGVINNAGLIKKTSSSGEAQIIVTLNNNDGTIQVEEGTLSFQNTVKSFIDGTYNVFSGATLDWDFPITISGSLEGTLNGVMNWNQNITVAENDSASLNFTENFNWTAGAILGGGTLTNNGLISLISNSGKTVSGATILNNLGTIEITSTGDLFLSGAGTTLNNELSGIIDLQANAGNITWGSVPGVINNAGLIKKTTSTGEAQIITTLNNNNGTIQVEEGTLSFQNTVKSFTDGTYNVFSGATLDWDFPITISGSLEGTLSGIMNWNQNVTVATGDTAELNFTEGFNWTTGAILGGGTLTNNSVMSLIGNSGKTISGATTLNNSGTIEITSVGDLFISGAGTTLNNQLGGVIDLQSNAGDITWGSISGIINNFGLISRTTDTGIAQIFTDLNNSGVIDVVIGELEITNFRPFVNNIDGVVKGIGIFDMPANAALFTNNGIFAPGSSPGTLTVQGDYTSTSTSQLDIELNGLIPDTEHDVLAIQGNNVVFEGSVNVTMGFEGTIGDEFTIATTSGTIATGNLQSPIENVDFDGKRYTFDVSYPDNNKVVLTITDKLDILPPDVITQNITVQLDATGNVSIVPADIDNGTTDNCTPTNELVFGLDVDSFTCADLGDNTVNLTVTDNDGNFATVPATVTVEDVTDPTVVTQNITVQLDATGNASIMASQINNGSTDNCTITDLSLDVTDFTCADIGSNTVTLTATDQSGNMSSDTAMVTVEDNVAPTVVTQNITIQLGEFGSVSISPNDIDNGSSDACGVAMLDLDVSDFTCADIGTNVVTLTVTDSQGNSASDTAMVTVEDDLPPSIVAQNITVQLDGTGNVSISPGDVDNGSSDNCGIVDMSLDVSDFTCADIGPNNVNLSMVDSEGNFANDTVTVTVEDTMSPTVVTQNIIVALDGSGLASITTGDIDNGSSDNCAISNLSLDRTSFSCSDLGPNMVTLTATDPSGNMASEMATVTIIDDIDPVVVCPDGFNIESDGDYTLPDYVANNIVTVSDNCGFNVVQTPAPGTDLSDGDYIIEFDVTDDAGNTANCSFELKVEDTTLSIGENELLDTTLNIYPNPVRDTFTLNNPKNLDLETATIIDVKGSIIQKIDLRSMGSKNIISMQGYQSGVYFVRIETANSATVKRIVKL